LGTKAYFVKKGRSSLNPRAVATGGAAARRSPPTRNPWMRVSLFLFSPRSGEGCSPEPLRDGRIPLPRRGRIENRRRLPRVALRPPVGGLRSTRGYSPSPRWGENRRRVPRVALRWLVGALRSARELIAPAVGAGCRCGVGS